MSDTAAPTTRQSAGRIFKNARTLLGGKAAGGVLSLAYLAIAARTLGPTQMGYLVLAHAYVMAIAGIARFQSWQAVIRFGAPMVEAENFRDFKTLVRFTAKIDGLSGLMAVIIALAGAGLAGRIMNWPDDAMGLIYVYCFTAPFLMAATPTGVLRLFDEFKTLGWQLTLMPSIRLVGASAMALAGMGLTGFLIVWIIGAFMHGVSLWFLGWRALKKRKLIPALTPGDDEKASSQWLPFMIKTNLSSSVDVVQNNLPVLLVGAFLGGAASGFLQLATNLSNLIAHPTNLLNQASFPELSKIAANQGKHAMRAVAFRAASTGVAFAAPIVLVYVLLRKWLVVAVGGPEFAAAAILVALMAFSQLWRIASVVLQSAVIALGKAGFDMTAQVLSAVINIALMSLFLPKFGVAGAPAAIIAAWLSLIVMYLTALRMGPKNSTSPA